jgi:hypothetical protein
MEEVSPSLILPLHVDPLTFCLAVKYLQYCMNIAEIVLEALKVFKSSVYPISYPEKWQSYKVNSQLRLSTITTTQKHIFSHVTPTLPLPIKFLIAAFALPHRSVSLTFHFTRIR